MKVTTDGCLFGAWAAGELRVKSRESGVALRQAQDLELGVMSRDHVLDIGAGTGLLSLMIAQENPKLIIDAIEIDKEAYEQAKENIKGSPWSDRIHVIHSDIKEFQSQQQYDIIVSNPPFYENELKSGNSKKNKAHHDDALLLDDLLTIIQQHLKPNGQFYLLLPYKRNSEIDSSIAKNKLNIKQKLLVKQSTQHNYFRILLSGTHAENKNADFTTSEIAIRNDEESYTPQFITLLKDYYLHL